MELLSASTRGTNETHAKRRVASSRPSCRLALPARAPSSSSAPFATWTRRDPPRGGQMLPNLEYRSPCSEKAVVQRPHRRRSSQRRHARFAIPEGAMHPKSNRRIATRTFTSHVIAVMALVAALSFTLLGEASAQHSGRHGHHGHEGHGAKEPPASKKKAPAKKRGSAHARLHGATASDVPATREFQVAHHRMMRNMAVPYTGDADVDFRIQMIPPEVYRQRDLPLRRTTAAWSA